MNAAARAVMDEFGDVVLAFGQSDEYRWVLEEGGQGGRDLTQPPASSCAARQTCTAGEEGGFEDVPAADPPVRSTRPSRPSSPRPTCSTGQSTSPARSCCTRPHSTRASCCIPGRRRCGITFPGGRRTVSSGRGRSRGHSRGHTAFTALRHVMWHRLTHAQRTSITCTTHASGRWCTMARRHGKRTRRYR